MTPAVAALIATYRRPRELQRLLQSLTQVRGLTAVVVVDNEGSDSLRTLIEQTYPGAHYVSPGSNVGCGGGLKLAEEYALRLKDQSLTHVLILDDDAVLPPETIEVLADAMRRDPADLAYSLIEGQNGCVGWLPGLAPHTIPRHNTKEQLRDSFDGTPEEFRVRFGTRTRDFIWAQGICLLVAKEALERLGTHRDDFWVRGEDLEFSLRFTARGRGILVPGVVAQHLPPAAETVLSREAEYLKHCALVQNIAYIGFRLPHGRRIAWTIAGALRRFFRIWSWPAFGDALRALWRGAVLGEPAGTGKGQTFRARFAALPRPTP